MIYVSALQVDKAILFSTAITIAAFGPLFTMQGVEGQIFGPMARTYGYALAGALIATFTVTPYCRRSCCRERIKETETLIVRGLHRIYRPVLDFALDRRALVVGIGVAFLVLVGDSHSVSRQRVPAGFGGRKLLDPRGDAPDHVAGRGHRGDAQDA